MVRVNGASFNWWARFPFGFPGYPLQSGLVACPHPLHLLVVPGGVGHYLPVNAPLEVQSLPINPVRQVLSHAPSHHLLIADHTTLICIGERGLLWKTAPLEFDDLCIEGVDGSVVTISGFEPRDQNGIIDGAKMLSPSSATVSIALSLHTGEKL